MKKNQIFILLIIFIALGIIQLFLYSPSLPKSDYLRLSKGNLAYDFFGPATANHTVFVIHGSPGSKNSMKNLASSLASSNTNVYSFDMYCFGESSHTKNCGIIEASNTLNEAMVALNLSEAIILGYSWGGSVAITFASTYPKKTRSLILLSSNGIQEGEPTQSFFFERLRSFVAFPFVAYYPGSIAGSINWRTGFLKSYLQTDLRPIRSELTKITAPSFILHGSSDSVILPWVAKEHQNLIPGSKLEFFSGGHGTVFNPTLEMIQKINRFLNANE